MAKVATFIRNHLLSVLLLFVGILFIAFKIPGLLAWDWWAVLIPFYLFIAYWVVLILIGAYITKKEEAGNE